MKHWPATNSPVFFLQFLWWHPSCPPVYVRSIRPSPAPAHFHLSPLLSEGNLLSGWVPQDCPAAMVRGRKATGLLRIPQVRKRLSEKKWRQMHKSCFFFGFVCLFLGGPWFLLTVFHYNFIYYLVFEKKQITTTTTKKRRTLLEVKFS